MTAHHAQRVRHPALRNLIQLAGDVLAALRRNAFGLTITAVAIVLIVAAAVYLAYHDAIGAAVIVLFVGVPGVTGSYAYRSAGRAQCHGSHHRHVGPPGSCLYPYCRYRRPADAVIALQYNVSRGVR